SQQDLGAAHAGGEDLAGLQVRKSGWLRRQRPLLDEYVAGGEVNGPGMRADDVLGGGDGEDQQEQSKSPQPNRHAAFRVAEMRVHEAGDARRAPVSNRLYTRRRLEVRMRLRIFALAGGLTAAALLCSGQSVKPEARKWTAPRTPDGRPDLQG